MVGMKTLIIKPDFDQGERELLVKSLETGWVVQSPFVAGRFEVEFYL